MRSIRPGEVRSVERDVAAGDPSTRGQQTEHRRGDRRLTRTGFPDDSDGLPGVHGQVDTGDCGIVGPVSHFEAVEGEQRFAHSRRPPLPRDPASSASRSASPISMNANTVSASAVAG